VVVGVGLLPGAVPSFSHDAKLAAVPTAAKSPGTLTKQGTCLTTRTRALIDLTNWLHYSLDDASLVG
jgi:hypothetical protein